MGVSARYSRCPGEGRAHHDDDDDDDDVFTLAQFPQIYPVATKVTLTASRSKKNKSTKHQLPVRTAHPKKEDLPSQKETKRSVIRVRMTKGRQEKVVLVV